MRHAMDLKKQAISLFAFLKKKDSVMPGCTFLCECEVVYFKGITLIIPTVKK